MDEDVEITRRRAERPGLTLSGEPDPGAGIDAGGNGNVELLRGIDPALASARPTRLFDHFAAALAGRAGALDHEEALLGADLPMTAAQVATARAGARLSARSRARITLGGNLDFDLGLLAVEGIVEIDFQIIAQIGAAPGLLTPAAAECGTKDRLENIADVRETGPGSAAATAAIHALFEGFVAEPVIGRTLLRVLQNIIGFADRLEPALGRSIAGIFVGVPAHRQLAIRRFDHGIVRAAFNLEQFVIVRFDRHGRPPESRPAAALCAATAGLIQCLLSPCSRPLRRTRHRPLLRRLRPEPRHPERPLRPVPFRRSLGPSSWPFR